MSEAAETASAYFTRQGNNNPPPGGFAGRLAPDDGGDLLEIVAWLAPPKPHRPSAVEFRRLMLALVRAGRSPEALSRDFEPMVEEIWRWVIQVAWDGGRKADGLTRAEREELGQLRREVRDLRTECASGPWPAE